MNSSLGTQDVPLLSLTSFPPSCELCHLHDLDLKRDGRSKEELEREPLALHSLETIREQSEKIFYQVVAFRYPEMLLNSSDMTKVEQHHSK